MIMRKLGYILLLGYVFIVPIYYQHLKESWIGRGNHWDNKTKTDCIIMSSIWPITLSFEIYKIITERCNL